MILMIGLLLPGADPTAAPRVRSLADEFFAASIETFPEQATSYGMTEGPHGRLTDNSLAALARWQEREDAWLARLRAIDPAPLAGREEWVLYGILREQLEAAAAQRVCRSELWPVNSYQEGWQSRYTDLARRQPVGSEGARKAALARARALPRVLDVEVQNLRSGVTAGYTAPKAVVRSVITQLDGLVGSGAASSPLASPAERDPDPAFRAEYVRAIAEEVFPAIARYRKYLAREYLEEAREALGVSANPNGAACYAAAVRGFATVARSPEAVYALGLSEMDRIEGALRVIAERDFATSDPWGLLARLSHEPQYTFRSGDEIIAMAQAAMDRAKVAMPHAFGRLPKADVIIEPYPLFRQKAGAPGQYNSAPEDGSRPGIFNINPYLPEKQSRSDPEATTSRDPWPGNGRERTRCCATSTTPASARAGPSTLNSSPMRWASTRLPPRASACCKAMRFGPPGSCSTRESTRKAGRATRPWPTWGSTPPSRPRSWKGRSTATSRGPARPART